MEGVDQGFIYVSLGVLEGITFVGSVLFFFFCLVLIVVLKGAKCAEKENDLFYVGNSRLKMKYKQRKKPLLDFCKFQEHKESV